MSIVRQNVTTANGAGSTNFSFSHTCNGYYRGLVVFVYRSVGAPTSVTYGGVAMTYRGQDGVYTHVYTLENPLAGINTVLVTGTAIYYCVAVNYTGVKQSGLFVGQASDSDSDYEVNPQVITTTSGNWLVSQAYSTVDATFTSPNTNFLLIDQVITNPWRVGDSNGAVGVGNVYPVIRRGTTSGNIYGQTIAIAPDTLLALLSTSAVTGIGLRTATANGNVEYDGDVAITQRGFCYGTSTLPTTSGTKVIVSGTVGTYTGSLTGITPNTLYYVRSYAINSYGTAYGNEVTFTTNNIASTELTKDTEMVEGGTYAVSLDLTGTTGTVTVLLGRDGTPAVFTATGGTQTMQGDYSGEDGVILTRSADFNGTIDNLKWVRVLGTGTIDWARASYTTVFPIESEVYFKRIEDDAFNNFRLYRYLDLLFKDLAGYVTVTILEERSDGVAGRERTFSVGNTGNPASPFSKKRISFLSKNQAIIIGLSSASQDETFAIAQFLLEGDTKPKKTFSASKIISL